MMRREEVRLRQAWMEVGGHTRTIQSSASQRGPPRRIRQAVDDLASITSSPHAFAYPTVSGRLGIASTLLRRLGLDGALVRSRQIAADSIPFRHHGWERCSQRGAIRLRALASVTEPSGSHHRNRPCAVRRGLIRASVMARPSRPAQATARAPSTPTSSP